ncbi:branched-chain amino acid aminotransferase [Klebsiella pneumoniae]|uniref:Branched-chain amino acid aminotransferase n=1 Tax=Klebsiella pneumoniae TaxID=573 RepID=A0A377XJV6_KLEPN|nr:branched-chain amino acid aminotransferase [Klebsiella pneumoniae]VTM68424.1 branched-chain amino acid aminotransferase [Klebsiella pneumoniae]
MTTKKADYIWFNGEMVPWGEAKVHVMSHALHYGTSVFEGIRCYDSHKGPVVFRHREHMQRLHDSAKIYRFPGLPERRRTDGSLPRSHSNQ